MCKKYYIGGKKVENICIIGAGNEGHYFCAILGSNEKLKISLLTSKPEKFNGEIEAYNTITEETVRGKISKVSSDPKDVVPQADMLIFLVPSNIYKKKLDLIKDHVKDGTILGFIPGTGGVEFCTKEFIERSCPVFGTQRVSSGTKLVEYGKRVNCLGSRKDLRVAAIPGKLTDDICAFLGDVLDIKTVALPNYLSVTFTPSNPILHTSRLYGLFHDYKTGTDYDKQLSFYKMWDSFSSETLLGCNDELMNCCKALDKYVLSEVSSLREHYEINTAKGENDVEKMTNKIRSLVYLKDLVPMLKTENGKFIPDFNSRYFTEDYPYGLTIIRAFCGVCGIDTPHIDNVLRWYDDLFSKNYYTSNEFNGSGLKELPIPQNYGIHDKNGIYDYYEKLEKCFNGI